MSDITNGAKAGMDHAIAHLDTELKNIRTGRANAGMVEGIMIEVYGTQMRLKELANISVPETRQLVITAYDQANARPIYTSLEKANMGFKLSLEGNVVRVTIAAMDESQRKEMVKLCHKRREEAKVSIRNVRRDANEVARKKKADGTLSEDDLRKEEKAIQELTDKYCSIADKRCEVKEKEVSTI